MGKLKVSVASDVVRDIMRIILHDDDYPLLEGVIDRDRQVVFTTAEGERSYPFEETRLALQDFIDKLAETQNDKLEDEQG